jgi:hypothetical protein
MKRLTLFVASVLSAVLPVASARAAPGGLPLGCGPAGDVAEPTGLAMVETGDPAETAAPVAMTEDPVLQDSDVHTITDHDIYVALIAVCIVLIIVILV